MCFSRKTLKKQSLPPIYYSTIKLRAKGCHRCHSLGAHTHTPPYKAKRVSQVSQSAVFALAGNTRHTRHKRGARCLFARARLRETRAKRHHAASPLGASSLTVLAVGNGVTFLSLLTASSSSVLTLPSSTSSGSTFERKRWKADANWTRWYPRD